MKYIKQIFSDPILYKIALEKKLKKYHTKRLQYILNVYEITIKSEMQMLNGSIDIDLNNQINNRVEDSLLRRNIIYSILRKRKIKNFLSCLLL